MSGVSSIRGYDPNLAALLAQAQERANDATPADAVASGVVGSPAAESSASPAAPDCDLETQVQAAISAALLGAEQSGGGDLKDAIYNALVKVLKDKGIDPKTLKPTADGNDGPESVNLSTGEVLAQIMAAVNKATTENNPLAQVAATGSGVQADGLWAALGNAQDTTSSDGSLAGYLALGNGSLNSSELPALLAASQKSGGNAGNALSQMLSPETNNQNLLGFLFDSER